MDLDYRPDMPQDAALFSRVKTGMSVENYRPKSRVIGPSGELLTLSSLPPPDTKRWVIRRKAEVVAAVRGGLLTLEEACERYSLSVEEFLSWQRMIEAHGLQGLRTTRVQDYRRDEPAA
jgi:hypothetical protein